MQFLYPGTSAEYLRGPIGKINNCGRGAVAISSIQVEVHFLLEEIHYFIHPDGGLLTG
jgi:hypothetical protein